MSYVCSSITVTSTLTSSSHKVRYTFNYSRKYHKKPGAFFRIILAVQACKQVEILGTKPNNRSSVNEVQLLHTNPFSSLLGWFDIRSHAIVLEDCQEEEEEVEEEEEEEKNGDGGGVGGSEGGEEDVTTPCMVELGNDDLGVELNCKRFQLSSRPRRGQRSGNKKRKKKNCADLSGDSDMLNCSGDSCNDFDYSGLTTKQFV